MRAVVTVIGKDMVGILAAVSCVCAEAEVNITEVTQSVLQDLFAMIMLVDLQGAKISFADLSQKLEQYGNESGLNIRIMNENIFNSMHRI